MSIEASPAEQTARRWRPLEPIERRVLGVLVEKAKTTPENYPLSLNAIRVACNQKTNRAPLMQLDEPQVDEALESLRKAGAVAQIQGDGRVEKYRHLAYEWLGVEKVELAVMAELLLRGTQTVGELRGRAARMEPIKDLAELQPTLDSLHAKALIAYLSPPGRGSLVTHALYLDRERDKVYREAGVSQPLSAMAHAAASTSLQPTATMSSSRSPETAQNENGRAIASTHSIPAATVDADELQQLREGLAEMKRELLAVRADFESTSEQLRRDLDELNRQLGN